MQTNALLRIISKSKDAIFLPTRPDEWIPTPCHELIYCVVITVFLLGSWSLEDAAG